MPNFGTAIEKLELQPHFDDTENRVGGGTYLFDRHKAKLKTLPSFTFSRRNHNLTMKYLSKVCLGVDLHRKARVRDSDSPIENKSAAILRAFYLELIEALKELRSQIKQTDDFDVEAFLKWVASRIDCLPKTNEKAYQIWSNRTLEIAPTITKVDTSYLTAMTEDEFWNIIDLIDTHRLLEDHSAEAVAPVLGCLELESVDRIKSFYNHLANALYALRTSEHWKAAVENQTDDCFLYLRCFVVARGYKFYQQVRKEPQLISQKDLHCEPLLIVASRAWAKVTKDEPMNFPEDCAQHPLG